MAAKKSYDSEPIGRFEKLVKKLEPLSKLPLEKRIQKLRDFEKRKKNIESELKYLNFATTHLEEMPDVARYHVLKNDFAQHLLVHLNNHGGITYGELRSSFPKESQYGTILNFGIDLLVTAQLIERQFDPYDTSKDVIKLNNSMAEAFGKKQE